MTGQTICIDGGLSAESATAHLRRSSMLMAGDLGRPPTAHTTNWNARNAPRGAFLIPIPGLRRLPVNQHAGKRCSVPGSVVQPRQTVLDSDRRLPRRRHRPAFDPACGFAIAEKNARPEVKPEAHLVTSHAGGDGAARDAVEYILRAEGNRRGWWLNKPSSAVDETVDFKSFAGTQCAAHDIEVPKRS